MANDPLPSVCVVGLGYIGLPTASTLATKGFHVHGVDVNEDVVANLNEGRVLIYEPSLDIVVKSAVNSGNLKASKQPESADVFVLAVPTPFKDGNEPDLTYVEQAARNIAPYLEAGNLVILESTSPVGATERVAELIQAERKDVVLSRRGNGTSGRSGEPVYVAHCPERVLPGDILREIVDNDRIVGGIDAASTDVAIKFYSRFVSGELLATDSRTAELAKLTENAYRDVNIAFANELSLICDRASISVWELVRLANHHPRVNILQPGPGVGGHCIAVDPWFIVSAYPDIARMTRTAREVNSAKPGYVVERIIEKADRVKDPVIACLGLSYKPDIDDLRESPSIEVVEQLAKTVNGTILVVEPNITDLPESLDGHVTLTDLDEALDKADIVVALVAHREFRAVAQSTLKDRILLDFVNAFA